METDKQNTKQYDWLKPYQFKKGQSGNPQGRKPGKTLKTFVRELIEQMPDEEKIEYLKTLSGELIWQMAEGKPQQDTDITTKGEQLKIVVEVSKEVADKYALAPDSNSDSEGQA